MRCESVRPHVWLSVPETQTYCSPGFNAATLVRPAVDEPQHTTSPVLFNPHTWYRPAETEVQDSPGPRAGGESRPGSMLVDPKHLSSPVFRVAQV